MPRISCGSTTAESLDVSPIRGLVDLEQYTGLWAIDDGRFMAQFDQIRNLNLLAHIELHQGDGEAISAARAGRAEVGGDAQSIAVISIRGTMTKRGSSMSNAGSTVAIRRAVREAVRDPEVIGIMLTIDSPGGTVAGTADLGREVARANSEKPVFTFCEDLCASAGYWVGSQAERVYANDATALIGSIGTFVGLYDYSAKAADDGVRPVVIKAGRLKGAGFEGTEITEEQVAYWQGIVDETQAQFTAAIQAGRKLSLEAAEKLVEGRVWLAPEAKAKRLIDGIQSYQDTFSELSRLALSRQTKPRRSAMTQERTTEAAAGQLVGEPLVLKQGSTAASYEDLKACLPGANAEFICSQLEKKATLDQAQSAWMEEQNRRIEAAQKKAQAAEAGQAAKKLPGVEALGGAAGAAAAEAIEDPLAQFNQEVRAKMKQGMDRQGAVVAVARANKPLHQAYLKATNPQRRKIQSLIDERFELEE